jgi:4a-hydroxytetrahydrobiopterin dehydratase
MPRRNLAQPKGLERTEGGLEMTQTAEPLAERKCVPCEGGTPPLTEGQIKPLMAQVNGAWSLEEGKLVRQFKFRNFRDSMAFVNKVADLAESEGHHPDIYISYNRVRLTLFTHAIKGLSENDFIMAAKIDSLGA